MPSYLNTEPDLDENESIVEEYPSESYLVRRDDPEGSVPTFTFHTPARPIIEFDDEDRARLFADLYLALGGFRIKEGVGPNGIPVTVASSGKAGIASYMYSVWGKTPTEIANTLEQDRNRVLGYFDQIRSRADDVIEAADEAASPPGEAG
ncbi:Uncharacterized protein HSRCO_2564 [Halanaeroarchaeum sp. HSR-CO]|uniref:hypothetical protein n=1 Tax=Halanaeroarchaeum sp. HSR-CO TaxID=2866382 RepID=UPI00217E4849|nr:hypothetical protein [Halanaeroarchaeum sp. HSR-CO]UWG48826.1 Uncharacterized protein HSRCO_2564 [Halanaeroarchaeum sp. HSR-CO]